MAVNVWPQLQNATEVKSFLGLCGFYQRFVADYATVATPLTNLMGKKAVWKCGEEKEGAEGHVVAIPGVDGAEFQVAYDSAYGCVLCGGWCYVVTERRRGRVEVGGMSKSEVVVSGKELHGAREGDVGVG